MTTSYLANTFDWLRQCDWTLPPGVQRCDNSTFNIRADLPVMKQPGRSHRFLHYSTFSDICQMKAVLQFGIKPQWHIWRRSSINKYWTQHLVMWPTGSYRAFEACFFSKWSLMLSWWWHEMTATVSTAKLSTISMYSDRSRPTTARHGGLLAQENMSSSKYDHDLFLFTVQKSI